LTLILILFFFFSLATADDEAVVAAEEEEEEEENMEGRLRGGKRRRKMMGGGEMEVEVPPRLKSVSMFEGHKDAVTGVAWASTRSLFTGSFDHNIVSWDVEAGVQLNVLYGSKAVTGLDYNPRNALLVSSHPDHIVRVWDPRMGANEVAPIVLKSHSGWVTSAKWSAHSEYVSLIFFFYFFFNSFSKFDTDTLVKIQLCCFFFSFFSFAGTT